MLEVIREQEEGVLFLNRVIEKHLQSPLLLVGEEGVGRRYSVQQAARAMFCLGSRAPNCSCVDCTQLQQGVHPDFTVLSPVDDRDIGVDSIRALVADAGTYPTMVPFRIFLIDGADRMTNAAANALLKTLEEPPVRARFFLLAESADYVIPTIRSRCGLVRYRNLSEAFVLSIVQRFEGDVVKALVYARMGEGSVGRALRYCSSGRLALRDRAVDLIKAGIAKDLARSFAMIDQCEKDLSLFLRFLGQLLHDLILLPHDSVRIINVDISDALGQLRSSIAEEVWQRFRGGIQEIIRQSKTVSINVPFHVKTLLVDTFGV